MGVKDVRISPGLNQAIWARGIKSPPKRVRVRLERKRNDDEGAKEKLYVVASVVEGVTSFKVSWYFSVQQKSFSPQSILSAPIHPIQILYVLLICIRHSLRIQAVLPLSLT